jgi:hypothetical protein
MNFKGKNKKNWKKPNLMLLNLSKTKSEQEEGEDALLSAS